MTTPGDRLRDTGEAWADHLKPSGGTAIGDGQVEAEAYAEEWQVEVHQQRIQVTEQVETMGDTARHGAADVAGGSGVPLVGARGFDALEIDFRGHHQTNAARRRGPYEHYRLVYRYGYDLGSDPRYRSAEWSSVAQEARPRWEERNPGTWAEFKDTIRYAWDKARGPR